MLCSIELELQFATHEQTKSGLTELTWSQFSARSCIRSVVDAKGESVKNRSTFSDPNGLSKGKKFFDNDGRY